MEASERVEEASWGVEAGGDSIGRSSSRHPSLPPLRQPSRERFASRLAPTSRHSREPCAQGLVPPSREHFAQGLAPTSRERFASVLVPPSRERFA